MYDAVFCISTCAFHESLDIDQDNCTFENFDGIWELKNPSLLFAQFSFAHHPKNKRITAIGTTNAKAVI